MRALHLVYIEVGYADVPHFTFLLELGHHAPGRLNQVVRLRPVDLVEIDHVQLQPAQALFHFFADRLRLNGPAVLALLIPNDAALGENQRFFGSPRKARATTSSEWPKP